MAKLTKKDVLHVAKLAKVELANEEVKKYLGQLSKVVDYISQLSEVDISNVEPTSQTTGLTDVFRKDKIKTSQSLTQGEALSQTDKTHNGYFVVEAILSERTDK